MVSSGERLQRYVTIFGKRNGKVKNRNQGNSLAKKHFSSYQVAENLNTVNLRLFIGHYR